MPTQIEFSETESDILGLRIGRCTSDDFDESVMYQEIIEGKYDICRVKVPAEDEMAPHRLNKMGFPAFFSGSIRRYKTRISKPPAGEYFYNDLAFEVYDGSQDILLKQMLDGTWGAYPIGYYRTPWLSSLVSKEKEIESVFQYYKKHNLYKNNPDNSILFIRHGNLYVGFFALNIVGRNLESHIGGILEPYRKSNYFLDMLRYIKEFCIKKSLEYFIFGARNENAEVQRIFQYTGFTPIGTENVFHISALLTYSRIPVVMKQFSFNPGNWSDLQNRLYREAITMAGSHLPDHARDLFQINRGYNLSAGPGLLNVRFSFPVIHDSGALIVFQSEGRNDPPLTGYLSAHS
jgi:hypothetical protein